VKGGNGGFGFPRYGGEGGKGGDVCFVATEGTYLLKYRYILYIILYLHSLILAI